MSELPLIEKWRPKCFDDIIGTEHKETIISLIKDPKTMPNLLFWGSQGVGKTTTAKVIIKTLEPVDVLKISGSDTTGVDIIRDKVFSFVSSKSFNNGKPKIVWIEEFDFMSASAFAALRAMIEIYMKNSRFICTCNYIAKIPDPIKSRFSVFEFRKLKEADIINRLTFIASTEKIEISQESIKKIAENSKGDIRTAINMLQVNKDSDVSANETLAKEVYELLLKREWSKIRYDIPNKYPDYNRLLEELALLFFESELPTQTKANVTELIADGLFQMGQSFSPDITFSAVASRIIKVL